MEASVVGDESRLARDAAFERFYRRYASHVYRYTLAVLRNPADAEDVTQTTFLNAYRAMQAGQYPRKPHHWLIKIAHNACRSRYLMRRRRVSEVPLDEAIDQLVVAPEEKPNVRAVLRALGRLPFNQRAALVMRELEGRSYREIAETLGVSVSAVEMLIFRARKSMRRHVGSVRALGAVQLPGSLASYFESTGAAAGGLLGAGILAKVVAGLAAAMVVAGASVGSGLSKADTMLGLGNGEAAAPSSELLAASEPVNQARSAARAQKPAVTTRGASSPVGGSDAVESSAGTITSASRPTPAVQMDGSSGGGSGGRGGGPVDAATKALPAVPSAPAVTPPDVNLPPPPQVSAPPLPLPVEPPPLPEPPKLP